MAVVRSSAETPRRIRMRSQRSVRSKVMGAEQTALTLVRDPLRLILFVLTIVTISRVHLHYPILAKLRPVLLLTAGALGYAYLNPRYLTNANVLKLWPMRLVALLGVLAFGSAAFGISLGNSALFILDSFSKTLMYAFLIAIAVRHTRDLYTFVWAFAISCGILVLFSVFVFGLSAAGETTRLAEMYTYDSNDLGVILMIGLPLTLLLVVVDHGVKRLILLVTVVGIAIAMARSGSRGGFLGLIAVSVAALFLVNGVSATRRFSLLGAALFALGVAAPAGYWKQMSTILSPKEDYNYSSIDGRGALMKRGIGYMVKYPVFGIGVWNFAKAECTISPKMESRPVNEPVRCIAPHNSYVQAGAETGIPGLIVFSSLILGAVVAPIRMRRRLPQYWRKGTPTQRFLYNATSFFPIAMIGFAVTAFFVSFAFFDPLYLLSAFVTGLYIAISAQLKAEGRPEIGALSPSPGRHAGWRVKRAAVGSLARSAAR